MSVPGFVTRVDASYRIRYINRLAPGVAKESVLGVDVFMFINPEHHQIARACFEQVQKTGEPDRYEAVAGSDGNYSHYVNYVSPVRDQDGTVGLCIVGMDITAERAREAALRESQEKLRIAADATELALWEWEPSTGAITWDDRMLEVTGRTEPASLETFMDTVVHPEDRHLVERSVEALMAVGRMDSVVNRIFRPSGEIRWIMVNGVLHRNDDGEPQHITGTVLDVTEQHSMAEQLRQAQKMQAIGNLTAGVAHNFNNMLMVLMPSLELLEEQLPASQRDLLEDAKATTRRAADMIRQLMTFSGQSTAGASNELSVSELVSESVRMARRTFGGSIKLRTHFEETPKISGKANDLQQVLLNILLNARDALLSADRPAPAVDVYVDTARRTSPDQSEVQRYVQIRVHDNGCGMPQNVAAQVFEPFFTTKRAEGTGLGLSTSYAIVREHGGWIECASVVDQGTDFTVWLPASSSVPLASESAEVRARLLLVDDDEFIHRVIGRVLSKQYEVVQAASVAEVEELIITDQRFSLVLLDRSMPGASGQLLVPVLRRALPNTPILYFTGERVQNPEEVDGIIEKPLSRAALLEAIERALDKSKRQSQET